MWLEHLVGFNCQYLDNSILRIPLIILITYYNATRHLVDVGGGALPEDAADLVALVHERLRHALVQPNVAMVQLGQQHLRAGGRP